MRATMRAMYGAICDIVARLLAIACLAAVAGSAGAQQHPQRTQDCKADPGAHGVVRTVLDGRTILLADGRELQLAGVELPGSETATLAGKAALETMAGGREIAFKPLGAGTDRHGRIPVYAFAGGQGSIQQDLVALGHVRVAARTGDAACAAELFRAESAARRARLGLWAEPSEALRKADDAAAVLAQRGRFTLVEGHVISVRESGGTIYVNFGRRWSEDFTATVLKRSERSFMAAGLDLKKLAGRTVRVRGYVEERGGPWIEVTHPEQIELAE